MQDPKPKLNSSALTAWYTMENPSSISGRRKEFKLDEISGEVHGMFHLSKRTKLPWTAPGKHTVGLGPWAGEPGAVLESRWTHYRGDF